MARSVLAVEYCLLSFAHKANSSLHNESDFGSRALILIFVVSLYLFSPFEKPARAMTCSAWAGDIDALALFGSALGVSARAYVLGLVVGEVLDRLLYL